MFLKRITKPGRKADKVYVYYRLVHSYKIGTKVRQQTIMNLGKLENLPKEKHKLLADRIENLLISCESVIFEVSKEIEALTRGFVN